MSSKPLTKVVETEGDYVRRMEEMAAASQGEGRLYHQMCAVSGAQLSRMRFEANERGSQGVIEYEAALRRFLGVTLVSFILENVKEDHQQDYIAVMCTNIANDVDKHLAMYRRPPGAPH